MEQQLPVHPPMPPFVEEKELTLKDIILLVINYYKEIRKNWKILAYCVIPLASYFVISAITADIVYPSNITFLVTSDKDNTGMGDLTKIIGSFGLPTGAQDESALEKVLQLFRSRQIIENTLLQKSKINGKLDYIANHMIEAYTWEKLLKNYRTFGLFEPKWVRNLRELQTFRFTHARRDSFTTTENLAVKVLYEHIVGSEDFGIDPIVGSKIDEKSGIMNISLKTVSEELTAELLMSLYNQLSQYYIDKTVEKQKKIFDIANFKKDSIQVELNIADRQLAEFEDQNRALVWVTGELTRTRLQRKARFLEILYGESMKQAEASDFALRNKTPYVQIIDAPARPILPFRESWVKALLIGVGIGLFVASFFIIIRKVIRDNLQ